MALPLKWRPQNHINQGVICTGEPRKLQVIVGADAYLGEWLAEAMEEDGRFEVILSTDDGAECLSAFSFIRADLVILSTNLRKMDGVEVARRIKKEHPALKCLMLNPYGPFLAAYSTLAGVDCCLGVPCTKRALLKHAEELVLIPI